MNLRSSCQPRAKKNRHSALQEMQILLVRQTSRRWKPSQLPAQMLAFDQTLSSSHSLRMSRRRLINLRLKNNELKRSKMQ